MNHSGDRPRRGLSLEEAFARWADPALHEKLMIMSGQNPPSNIYGYQRISKDEQKRREFRIAHDAAEESFVARLKSGEAMCSGILEGAKQREIIHPSLWDNLEIAFELDDVAGNGLIFTNVEFFDPALAPRNVEPLPSWLTEMLQQSADEKFSQEAGYQQVSLGPLKFTFTVLQARVIKLMHEIVLAGGPPESGKVILGKAGSRQSSLLELFDGIDDFGELVESLSQGRYRLLVDRSGNRIPSNHIPNKQRKKRKR